MGLVVITLPFHRFAKSCLNRQQYQALIDLKIVIIQQDIADLIFLKMLRLQRMIQKMRDGLLKQNLRTEPAGKLTRGVVIATQMFEI